METAWVVEINLGFGGHKYFMNPNNAKDLCNQLEADDVPYRIERCEMTTEDFNLTNFED